MADPITYPTIQLANGPHCLKFRISDLMKLNTEHQIDLLSSEQPVVKGVAILERTAKIVAAGLQHAMPGVEWTTVAEQIDMLQIFQVSTAIAAAVGKVQTQEPSTPSLPAPAPPVVQ